MKTKNNYRVSGKRMTSRFGISVKADREATKAGCINPYTSKRGRYLSLRRRKRCTHPNMRDEGYGTPDTGCIDLYCPRCGYSYHHTLY